MNGYILTSDYVEERATLVGIGERVAAYAAFALRAALILLAFRFVLKLLGASAVAPATSLIYAITNTLLHPLGGQAGISLAGSVVEWQTLGAIALYAVLGAIVLASLRFASRSFTKLLDEPAQMPYTPTLTRTLMN